MNLRELANLVRVGQLKTEPSSNAEILGLLRSGEARLADAQKPDLSLESRFDLAYNAAHALALAALRLQGYRSNNRYVVFQSAAAHSRPARRDFGVSWQSATRCETPQSTRERWMSKSNWSRI